MDTEVLNDDTHDAEGTTRIASEPAGPPVLAIRDLRQQKIHEFQSSALNGQEIEEDLVSLVAANAGGMIAISSRLESIILDKLQTMSGGLDEMAELHPGLGDYLRVERQVERHVSLIRRIKPSRALQQSIDTPVAQLEHRPVGNET
jgi:hypothetical protein